MQPFRPNDILMTYMIESPAKSSLHTLRDALEQAERQLVRLDGANVETFLVRLDQIEQMFAEFGEEKVAARAEEGRWTGMLNRISAKPELVVNAAAHAGGLTKLRAKHSPATGRWWHLDVDLARRRTQTLLRIGMTIGAIVVVVAVLFIGSNYFTPSATNAGSLADTNAAIDSLVTDQKWPEALAVVGKARQTLPDEPELLVWTAVLAEQTGDAAHTSLAQAQQQFVGPPAAFWTLVGNRRLQVGNWAGAEEAAQQALASAPQDAQVTFLLGNIAEARGDTLQANAYFSQTMTLAGEANPALAALVRVRMGNLLQQVEPLPLPVPAPVETATAASP